LIVLPNYKAEKIMPIPDEPGIDPISKRAYDREFPIAWPYRWAIKILCICLAVLLLVLVFIGVLNPILDRLPMDWGVFFAIGTFNVFMLLVVLLHLARLPQKSVMIDDEGLWLSGRDGPDSFVPWVNIVDMRERTWVPGWVLLDARGRSLLSIDCEVDGFEDLHALLREHTCIPRSVRADIGTVWMSRAYAAVCLGMVAFGVLGAWTVWQDGLAGNWWYALAAVVLPLYPMLAVLQLRIEPDAIKLRRAFWKRSIRRNDITAIRMSQNPFGPVVAIECKADGEQILLEHLNVPAHVLYESLNRWHADTEP